jgi:predicted NACHT family NTPase
VTFKDLQKVVQSNGQTTAGLVDLQAKLQNKPFWIFDKEEHRQGHIRTGGQCCFWQGIGCPQKDGKDMPVLPYQKILYDALQNHKHLFIKKPRGLGVTTFLLRYIFWCSVSNLFGANSRVCIIMGPEMQ